MVTCALYCIFSSLRASFVFFKSSIAVFDTTSPEPVGVGVVDLGGLDRLERGDTALEMALGDKTEFAVIAKGPFILGWNRGFANPAGTLTEPHEGNPFGAGETRLDEMSTFFVRFRTEFLSTDFPESRVIGGFPEFATCGLGTLNSALLEPSLDVSIVLRLGMARFDRAIRPPSLASSAFQSRGRTLDMACSDWEPVQLSKPFSNCIHGSMLDHNCNSCASSE